MAPSFDCCINANYHSGTAVGVESNIGGLNAYVTGPETADKAILIIADVHGKSLLNTRLLADKYAQACGARVYVPDFFNGEDILQLAKSKPNAERSELVKYMLSTYDPRDFQRFPSVVQAIRAATPSAKKVGVVGFCWGGPGAVFLGTDAVDGAAAGRGGGQADAVAFAHPSKFEPSDFERLQRPGLFLFCQNDAMFPKDKQATATDVLERRAKQGIFSRTAYFPFVSHGWTIKGDESDPYSAKAMAHATAEVIGFFSLELSSP